MSRHTLISILSISAAVFLFTVSWLISGKQQLMPEIQFTDIDGRTISTTEYANHPVLVVFWATDCSGCIKEIPDLIALNEQFQSQGFEILAIAMSHDQLPHIQSMREQRQLPYTIVWDSDSTIARAFNNVRVTPTHFLISPEGKIVMRKIGELNIEHLKKTLNKMGLS